ncbi:MAG: hypothetical protein R3F53_29335 [Gammaproteobacteria bacterium]
MKIGQLQNTFIDRSQGNKSGLPRRQPAQLQWQFDALPGANFGGYIQLQRQRARGTIQTQPGDADSAAGTTLARVVTLGVILCWPVSGCGQINPGVQSALTGNETVVAPV